MFLTKDSGGPWVLHSYIPLPRNSDGLHNWSCGRVAHLLLHPRNLAHHLGSLNGQSKRVVMVVSHRPLILSSQVFMPETPSWLLSRNLEPEARMALQQLRGKYVASSVST